MKYKTLIPLFICTVFQFSCDFLNDADSSTQSLAQLPAFDVQWNNQSTLVCFGTSLTYGYGAGEKKFLGPGGPVGPGWNSNNIGDSSYPRFLQEKLKITVLNKGYVGARISYALTVLSDSVLSKKPALILLEYGANDFLWDIPSHTSDSLLSLLIVRIQQNGTKVVLLSFIHPDMLQYTRSGGWSAQDSLLALDYNSMINTVAQRFGIPLIDYPLRGVFGHPELMSDGLHPNGEGYKIMEQNIYYALINTFTKNGMLK